MGNELKEKVDPLLQRGTTNYYEKINSAAFGQSNSVLTRIGLWPMYRSDMYVRRALALQQSAANEPAIIKINREQASQLGINSGDRVTVSQNNNSIQLSVAIDDYLPNYAVYVSGGFLETSLLGGAFSEISISNS